MVACDTVAKATKAGTAFWLVKIGRPDKRPPQTTWEGPVSTNNLRHGLINFGMDLLRFPFLL